MALALGLPGTAAAQAPAREDPVYDLQQALQVRTIDLEDPQALAEREKTLKRIIQQLHTISELRRALALTGWRDEINDYDSTQPVENRETRPKSKMRSEVLIEIDRDARKSVGEKLAKKIEEDAKKGDSTNRLALAAMLMDMGTSIRGLGDPVEWQGRKYSDWRGYARRFTPLLAKMTHDPSEAVRIKAAVALGRINPDPQVAVPALKAMLQKGTVAERRAAIDGLLTMIREINKLAKKGRTQSGVEAKEPGEILEVSTAVTPVAGLGVDDRDVLVRRQSLATLLESAVSLSGQVPIPFDPKDLPPRNVPLTDYQRKVVREKMAQTRYVEEILAPLSKLLADQGDRLARALSDPDPETRLLARQTLEYMANARQRMRRRWESLPELKGEDKASAQAEPAHGLTFTALQAKGSPDERTLLKGVTPGLLALARQKFHDPNPVNRRAAIDFLEMLEDDAAPAVPLLIQALSDPDIFVRWSAARTLGRLDVSVGAPAVPALARTLSDPDLDVRITAASTLEAYGSGARKAIPALAEAVGNKNDPEFVRAAMYALQAVGPEASRAATPALLVELRHDDPRVRRTAAETLGRFGPAARNAVPALRAALNDEDSDVRQAASDALLSILPTPG
jgi:HEAT repeat protein